MSEESKDERQRVVADADVDADDVEWVKYLKLLLIIYNLFK